ncbi:MAG: cell division protein ZipA [Alcanivoracaceae bacterium]|nr:cell division protein ZipA [Alcanivoracaceae bacterium]
MGLNLETLIGILVILILLILADGLRRMLRERGSRLRVRIDPRVREYKDDEQTDQRNPELPSGGARVIGSREAAQQPQRPRPTPPPVKTRQAPKAVVAATVEDETPPPVVMEADETPAPVVEATQQELFSEPAATKSTRQEILDVVVVHMVANDGVHIPGRDLLQQLLEQGLRFGDMNIFHRHRQTTSGNDELLFSMANALEPGTFDIDTMEEKTFRAVTFFMKLPGPSRPVETLDRMLASAKKLADTLGAELRDEAHSTLTPQNIEHIRQKVQDFERRQKLADVQ